MSPPTGYATSVFINCPFDQEFLGMKRAMIFALAFSGLEVRIATESSDSGEVRCQKILALIQASRFSVHDISRMSPGGEPRYNMPFELGLDLGLRYGPSPQFDDKLCLVLDSEPYRYRRYFSDISGQDIRDHQNDPERLVKVLRGWLQATLEKRLPGPTSIWESYSRFQAFFRRETNLAGWKAEDLIEMEDPEYLLWVQDFLQQEEVGAVLSGGGNPAEEGFSSDLQEKDASEN
ncbi:MAG: hypothetical protein DWQ01_01800 [Planctomycetota bacterium]|nr:MAG: hypothetical protein DWQ01_01800 [Planctomycetota bacterium]